MKKYIFLLVFFAQLVIANSQSVTRIWVGSTTSDDWNEPTNWDTGTVPDVNSIVNIPHLSTGLKYPKLSSLSNAKEVTIEANATLDLSTFSIIKADSFTCKIINKGILKLEGTSEHRTWFNTPPLHAVDKISLEDDSTVVYYGSSTADIFKGPYQNLKLLRDVKADRLDVSKKTLIERNITITVETQTYDGEVEAWDDVTFTTNTDSGTITFNNKVLAKDTGAHTFKDITIAKGIVQAKEKITANKLDISGESFVAEKNIELEDDFEGKSKKIETKGLVKAKNINIASSCDEWNSNDLTLTNDITQNGKKWNCNGVLQVKNINVGNNCTDWTSTNNITAEENIAVDDNTSWKANSGDIAFKKDLTAYKLEQVAGKVIANGIGNQNLKAKKIKELKIANGSSSNIISLAPIAQTIEKINNSGTLSIQSGVSVTVAEIENTTIATFTSSATKLALTNLLKNEGNFSCEKLVLNPTSSNIIVQGNSPAIKTKIKYLSLENAGDKILQIKNEITISDELKLTGSDKDHLLNIIGAGSISVTSSLVGEGEFLSVKTDIPINNRVYKTKHSKPVGLVADIEASHPSGWIFNQCLLALTWKGGASPIQTDWNNSFNWIPRSEPDEESEVNIPSGKMHYPILVANASAKTVAIETGASVDLGVYHILTTGSAKAKLNNSGKLLLSGTNAQKAWFEDTNVLNKIVLENGSTVAYHAGATDPIYAGPYKNLNLSRNVSADSLTVENITKVEQAVSITADNQTYRGKVNSEESVSFATTNENGTINFDDEILAKNTSSNSFKDVIITKGVAIAKNKIIANKLEVIGKSFVAEKNIELEDNFEGKSKKIETKGLVKAKNINIASSCDEWNSNDLTLTNDITQNGKKWNCNGVLQVRNINVGNNCTDWNSANNITAEENITVDDNTSWKANSGDIAFKKDLTAYKLEQVAGKVIANGIGNQNLKAKDIKELEINSVSSIVSLISLSPTVQTIEKISNSGTLNIPTNADLTIAEINNKTGATFNSSSEIKLTKEITNSGMLSISTLLPNGNYIKLEGSSVASQTTIATLTFENAGGKTLQIKNKITISNELKLKGSSETSLLTIEGDGSISVPSSLLGEGEFLSVKTNIPIETGTYKTKHSKPEEVATGDIEAGKPQNWIFNQTLYNPLTWKGGVASSETDWDNSENWIPRGVPAEENDVVIPSGKTHYPILVANASAKTVAIVAGASVDLGAYHILTTGSAKAKLNNSGKLLLSGTNAQKAWFEDTNVLNKIVLENGSTVAYHAGATDPIYAGPYKNLNLSRNVSADSLTVENITKVEQAVSITADNQTYRGKVNSEESVSFATTNENGTINFDDEILAKNTSSNSFKDVIITKGVAIAKNKIIANKLEVIGKSFVAEKNIELEDNFEGKSKKIETKGLVKAKNINIASSCDDWDSSNLTITDDITQDGKKWNCNGVLQVKNINVSSNCTDWTSTNNITVEENIAVDDNTSWKANSGDISIKGDLTASKLEQSSGNVIANGNGVQNIKAKTINKIEIKTTSNTNFLSIHPTTQKINKLTNSGVFAIPNVVNLTIEEIENLASANLTSHSEIILKKTILNSGILDVQALKLEPSGNTITIEGNNTQNNTKFTNLSFENANEKILEIKNNIAVAGLLKLYGVDETHVLTVKGIGKIYLSSNGDGKFLHVHTNIPIGEVAKCITKKSKPIGTDSEINAGEPENWIFDDPIMLQKWEGIDNSWVNRENWRPKGLPYEETETIIPSGKANYPLLTSDVNAKTVAIETGAYVDLGAFLIKTVSSKFSKISNDGLLKLEGTNNQKTWFEDSNQENKIILQEGCTVSYYSSSNAPIYAGPYKNLNLSRSVSASSLTVENITKIAQAISITADNQLYKGKVNSEEAVSFATTNENGTINFDDELLAKNTNTNSFKDVTITKGVAISKNKIIANKLEVIGKSFIAEKDIELEDNFEGKSKKIETKGLVRAKNINIASSCDEWDSSNLTITDDITQDGKKWNCNGVIQVKNINVGSNCTNWNSTNDITVLESIEAITSQWLATSGNISVFKDCNSPKLEQSGGSLILNGNGEQNLTAKTLNKLEMQNTSSVDKMKLKTETIAECILKTGNASLLQDIIITKEFINNGGVFDAVENKKLVTLAPIDTLTIKGKLSISGEPNPPIAETGTKFYQLHCKNAGGKTLHFTNAIEVLYDISEEGGYIPYPNENFTQDDKSLVLEGGSASSKLNITGDGQIWFNKKPPYPKPKKGGKFLHVASGVQIRSGCYRVVSSTHDKPAPRNWIFEEYAQIVSTLAINGTNELCITFSRPVAKPLPDSLKITSPSFSDTAPISVESYPKGSNKDKSDKWFFKFVQNFTPEMLLEKQAVISLGESSLDFIFESENSDAYPVKKGYISDIGLNLVNPVLAKNTKQIQTFDGTKTLPFINTSLFVDVPQVLDGRTLKLYADTNFNDKYWVPNKDSIPWKDKFKDMNVENSGAAGFSIDVGKSTPDTKMFILPTTVPQIKANVAVGFMFSYEDLPCARLINPNDIFSFDLWRFNFVGTMLQRSGVTILNNVINVSRDQQVGIEITTKASGILTVQIMTLDGNIVKTFVNDYKPQGNYSYYWNGRNEAGRAVARGMYFVRISGKGIDEIRKVLVIHD